MTKPEKTFLGVSVSRNLKTRITKVTATQKKLGRKATVSSVAEAAMSRGLDSLALLSDEELTSFFAQGVKHRVKSGFPNAPVISAA
ncbi:hypothetical protein DB346_24255 [Verrucomicrobia bacterium LW23]|nr:hypothetical protein DB346_24255 [Verrucomicrobia bacterium LW23]